MSYYTFEELPKNPNLQLVSGNILQTSAQAIVVPVNLIGVMGAGLAKQVKQEYPWVDKEYRKLCKDGTWRMGYIRRVYNSEYSEKEFFLFPTKQHWKEHSRLEYIDAGLRDLVRECFWVPPQSLAIPALGCGLGGLLWENVLYKLYYHLLHISFPVKIYVPRTRSERENNE